MATPGDSINLDAALDRALTRWGRLRLRTSALPLQFTAPLGVEIPGMDMHGVVDFTTDRCALDGEQQAMRFSGPDTYQQEGDGRWTVSDGPEGTWGMFHPHGLLEGLRVARGHVLKTGVGHFDVELDVERLGLLLHPGVHPEFSTRSEVILDAEGDIASASLLLTSSDLPGSSLENRFDFEWGGVQPTIELPPADLTITLAEHTEELMRAWSDEPDP